MLRPVKKKKIPALFRHRHFFCPGSGGTLELIQASSALIRAVWLRLKKDAGSPALRGRPGGATGAETQKSPHPKAGAIFF
jgi:hypothetical protein